MRPSASPFRDPAEYSSASYTPDFATEIDTLEDQLLEMFGRLTTREAILAIAHWHKSQISEESDRLQARALRGCVAMLLDAKNAKLAAYGLAFAAGLDQLAGLTMTSAAAKLGCTKAAISKASMKASRMLGLNRSRYQKSETASIAYRKRANLIHDRHSKPSKPESIKNDLID